MTVSSTPAVQGNVLEYRTPGEPPKPARVVSLDALRGFDMFWIIGGEDIIHAIATAFPSAATLWLSEKFEHVRWEGFRFYDLIFPLFVFMVGVSLVFSLSRSMQTRGRGQTVAKVIMRGVVLYAFGIFYYGGFDQSFSHIRLMGVLQRIAICYMAAGLLFCFLNWSVLVGVIVALLAGYWALMAYVPVPGVGHSFAEGKNLANWIDYRFLPLRKWDGTHDPEGLLSTLPAIGTCLLGVLGGLLVKEEKIRPIWKVLILVAAGAAMVWGGWMWGRHFPVVKKLWTSSFVLVAGGWSAILLGAFYLVIDVLGVRGWEKPFVWIGMNAITLYIVENIFKFHDLATRFVGDAWWSKSWAQRYEPLAVSIVAMGFVLLLARFLYVRKIFLKV